MKQKNNKRFYEQWWFWLMVFFLAFIFIVSFAGQSYEDEYVQCLEDSQKFIDAWDDYILAFEEYCLIDINNSLCSGILT